MGGAAKRRRAPAPPPTARPRGAGTGAQRVDPLPRAAANPLVLPCALVLLGPLNDAETGRPLSELLRAIGYL